MITQTKTNLEIAREQIKQDFVRICQFEKIEPELDRLDNVDLNGIKTVWIKGTQRHLFQNRPVIVKMRPLISQKVNADFIDVQKKLREISLLLNRSGLRAQKVMELRTEHAPEWLVLEYLTGVPVGRVVFEAEHLTDRLINYLSNLSGRLNMMNASSLNLPRQLDSSNWQREFAVRQHFIEKHLGPNIASKAAEVLKNPITFTNLSLVHSDLAPDNILTTGHNFIAIDWGGLKFASPATDWGTAWAFGVLSRDWQDKLFKHYMSLFPIGKKAEALHAFQQIATRLLATIAESYDYYAEKKENKPEYFAQAAKAIKNYPAALEELINVKI